MFDTGYSDIFIKNAEKLGIDLNKLDKLAFSHGHNDHTLGLKYFFQQFYNNNISIVAHPDTFKEKVMNNEEIPFSTTIAQLHPPQTFQAES